MMKNSGNTYNGIINIRKEAGFTSHDVVAKLRGILHQRKIGHTGTLDPDAVGVLPVCLGKATKLCDMIGDWTKTYEAVMLLGTETDTEDISGQILQKREVTVSAEDIRRIMKEFSGDYSQIPPMYSAKKQNGKKLYELAREGIVVERKPCTVHIFSIDILEVNLPEVRFSVTCSKGTYIRSLCRDIGVRAGCGACMKSLIRTDVQMFHLSEAYTLAEVEQIRDENRMDDILYHIDEMFPECPKMTVASDGEKKLYNGNTLPRKYVHNIREAVKSDGEPQEGTRARIYDRQNRFVGLYDYKSGTEEWKPFKLFFAGN